MTNLKGWMRRNQHALILSSIYIASLLLFAVILIFVHRVAHSDDYVFIEQIKPFPTLLDWLNYRYHTWSGRIFAESFVYIFSPLPLIFWKAASLVIYALFTGFLFLYYRLFTKNPTRSRDYIMLFFAVMLPLLMDTTVIMDGTLWVTGSMNYFWLITFALIAFYPFAYFVKNRKNPHWLLCFISLLSAIIAASSHEQIGATLVGLSVLFIGFLLFKYKNQKNLLYLIVLTAIIFTSFFIMIKAPGNQIRIQAETTARLPDFYTVPLFEHAEYAFRWILNGIINQFGLLLVLAWMLLTIIFFTDKSRGKSGRATYAIVGILAISLLLLSFKGHDAVSAWFNFHPSWKTNASTLSLLTLVPWSIAITATILSPFVIFYKKTIGYLLAILFTAAFSTTALVTLSPSMYASGPRVLFVPCIIMIIIIYILLDRLYTINRTAAYILCSAAAVLAISHGLILFAKYV